MARSQPHLGSVSTASIRAARRSSPTFEIFPRRMGTRACQIPDGAAAPGRFFGTCTTRFISLWPPGGDGLVEVVFTERWHGGVTVAGNEIWSHTTWNIFGAYGRVNSRTQMSRATPDQSWM